MNKLFWLDLETTGLDENKDAILEVGLIVTDWDLNELEVFSSVIKQPQHVLNSMNAFVRKMHTENGLFSESLLGMSSLQNVENEVLWLIKKNFDKKPVLAGGGIHFDRRFIKAQMPTLDDALHYRMLDVTPFKLLFDEKGWSDADAKKSKRHRSLDDIRESIDEFRHYVEVCERGIKA